jgi:LysM repeat protein
VRYLAPIALAAVIVATVMVVRGEVSTTHHGVARHRASQLPVTHKVAARKTFYVIQSGDSLSAISVKTGIPVATLESLNPGVDPNALQTGQRLRLRR